MSTNKSLPPMYLGMSFNEVPDDYRRVVHADLKSASGLGGGALQVGSGDETYSDAGISNGTTEWLKWIPSTAEIGALNKCALYHFEIESDFMEPTIAGLSNRILTLGNGGHKMMRGTPTNTYQQLDGTGGTSFQTMISPIDRYWTTHTVVDTLIQGSRIKTYVDHVCILDEVRGNSANNNSINLFASQSGTEIWGATDGGVCNQRIKNFYVVSGIISEIHHPQLSNIHLFGDSLTKQGHLQSNFPDLFGTAGSNWQDISYMGALVRACRSRKIYPRVFGHAVGGDNLADLQLIIDAKPNIAGAAVVVHIGINDAKGGNLPADWGTRYTSLIADMIALGADQLFLCTLATTADDSLTPEAVSRPAVDAANVFIRAEILANPTKTKKVDFDVAFGGRVYIPEYFLLDNLHWSDHGSRHAGETVEAVMFNHYSIPVDKTNRVV